MIQQKSESGHDGRTLPVALALIEHLNLTEDSAAAVTWSFLDYLEQNITVQSHYLKIA